jgi:hypothetical protein
MHVRLRLFFAVTTIALTRLNAQDVWTTSTSITTQSLNSVCWGRDLFIAVGDAGTIR